MKDKNCTKYQNERIST